MGWVRDNTAFIQQRRLFEVTDRLLVACSGGADSVALAYLLADGGYTFDLAHVNFQLRGSESDADAAFVEQLAEHLEVRLHQTSFNTEALAQMQPGQSVQMVARTLRYEWLEKVREAHQYAYILTGHHQDDNLETFLFNFSRGASLRGLRGIPLRNGPIIRPLLGTNRRAIEAFLRGYDIPFRVDSSNASLKYARNRIRHRVLPELKVLNPDLSQTVQPHFEQLQQAWLMVEALAEQLRAEWYRPLEDGRWVIERQALQNVAYGNYLLELWLEPQGFTPEQCRQALSARVGTLLEGETHRLLVQSEQLLVETRLPEGETSFPLSKHPGQFVLPTGDVFKWKQRLRIKADPARDPYVATLDATRLRWPLRIRRWQSGDRFQPFGMKGRSRKLQDFFTDQKIDRLQRQRCWILENGDGTIIWVVGYRMDHRFRLLSNSDKVVELLYEPPTKEWT